MSYEKFLMVEAEDTRNGSKHNFKTLVDLRCAICGRPTRSHEYKGLTYCHRCWVEKNPIGELPGKVL